MTKQPDIEQRIDNLNHIADGRILATKADLLTIVNEAVVKELESLIKGQYVNDFTKHIQARANELKGWEK